MSYSIILSMVDAEIARLEKARELLLSLSQATPRTHSAQPQHPHSPDGISLLAASEQPEEVAVKKLRPRRPYTARPKRTRVSPEAEGALRSAVPTGPVVVSANDVRKLASGKVAAAPAAAPAPAAPTTWRNEVAETRRTDDLLQRFMEMGTEGARPSAR